MTTLFKNGTVFTPRGFEKRDVFVSNGKVFVNSLSSLNIESADSVVDLMQVTDVRVRKIEKEGKMKAIVSITLDNEFVIHDIKVIEGEKGLFIAMPSRKAADGEYRDIAHPINSETRDMIQNVILHKYEMTTLEAAQEALERVSCRRELTSPIFFRFSIKVDCIRRFWLIENANMQNTRNRSGIASFQLIRKRKMNDPMILITEINRFSGP